MTTRHFTREQLEQIGVPFELDEDGCASELSNQLIGSERWTDVHRLVFRAPGDCTAYQVDYEVGSTEHQDGIDPWHRHGDTIEAVEVEQRPVVVQQWQPVGEEPAAVQPPAPDQTDLRDRIAEALISWTYRGQEPDPETGILETVRANAYSRADAVLAVLPAPVDRAVVLTETERTMLTYALDQAQEHIWSRDGFTDGDQAAVTSLRRLADEQPPTPAADDLAATTCSAQYHGHDEARLCIRAAQHTGKAHTDEHGFHWSDTVAVYPVDDGTFRRGTDVRAVLRRMADEEQPTTEPTRSGCTTPCIACMTDESHDPAPASPGDRVPREEVLAEVVAWLTKKAAEYASTKNPYDGAVAGAIRNLASKGHRGAVRANNLLGADLTTLDPTPLRWGLNDVMWGDDDTITVMLSGPAGEPYWLELDPERAAVLRQDLAGPEGEEQQPEAEAQPAADVWRGATELVPDREVQRLAATGLVGYQQDDGRLLHCLHHKPVPASRHVDFQEVTSDDLPDGGICVHPACGADLLAVQTITEQPAAVAQPGKET
ncbi:hypothetical protein U9R90_05390 [Streptomyces sp. E11-3]|uniref:hypothetical protein n=1 Tax=Streptomyces sp. E11-3 TaxID=3110112 RepID=UPI0039816B2C